MKELRVKSAGAPGAPSGRRAAAWPTRCGCGRTRRAGRAGRVAPVRAGAAGAARGVRGRVRGLVLRGQPEAADDAAQAHEHVLRHHLDAVDEQLSRDPLSLPTLRIADRGQTRIDDFVFEDFELVNYESHPAIRAEMAV